MYCNKGCSYDYPWKACSCFPDKSHMLRSTTLLLIFALTAISASAQSALTKPTAEQKAQQMEGIPTPPAETETPADPNDTPRLFSRLNGLFNGDLPQLDLPGTFKLILRPHVGDFIRRDYARLEAGTRWAYNEHFELTSEASVYFTHGLGGSKTDGYGVGRIRLGSKYIVERWPYPQYETSFTFNVEIPTGHPPVDMLDGNYHFSPTAVLQHNWVTRPRITTFGGFGLDILARSSVRGTYGTNQPHDHSASFITGAVYDMGQLKWTMTATYATTSVITSHSENFYYLQPGVLWYVPSKFTFHSKAQWIVGLGVRTTWGPDGFDFGTSSRVRAEITFRQVLDTIHLSPKKSTRH